MVFSSLTHYTIQSWVPVDKALNTIAAAKWSRVHPTHFTKTDAEQDFDPTSLVVGQAYTKFGAVLIHVEMSLSPRKPRKPRLTSTCFLISCEACDWFAASRRHRIFKVGCVRRSCHPLAMPHEQCMMVSS
jgi:hypothetical protein